MENHDWKCTFILPHKIAQETYLQSFQYKVVTRILNCNYNLHKWGIKDLPVCEYCNELDTITHHLFECQVVKTFWDEVELWIYDRLGVLFNLTICEIIFGIRELDELIRLVNYIILYGKLYINKQRTYSKKLTPAEFFSKLKDKIMVNLTLLRINECDKRTIPLLESLIS